MFENNNAIEVIKKTHSKYCFLEGFYLDRDLSLNGSTYFNLNLILTEYPRKEDKLNITFFGIRNLKINLLAGLLQLNFSIENISKDQLEGICYRVKEVENDMFSFDCASINCHN